VATKSDSAAALQAIDRAFDCLETALEHTGRLFATTETSAIASAEFITGEFQELPESLADPLRTLRRGLMIESQGLQLCDSISQVNNIGDFALAARNGRQISEDVLLRMRTDRESVEAKKVSK